MLLGMLRLLLLSPLQMLRQCVVGGGVVMEVVILTNHGGWLWEGGPPPSIGFWNGCEWLGMVGGPDDWMAGWLHD